MSKPTVAQRRILEGLCPNCGKEAAPYRLCFDCRFGTRIRHALHRGVREGIFQSEGKSGRDRLWRSVSRDPEKLARFKKWGTPFVLPDSDGRGKPRLQGMRIDIEATLLRVMEFLGRPCTIEEIMSAWGKLRDRRSSPLPNDLGRLIAAEDKRAAKMARRAALTAGQTP